MGHQSISSLILGTLPTGMVISRYLTMKSALTASSQVGRFIVHIPGAIAEVERGIIVEWVAEDMKLRTKRGK